MLSALFQKATFISNPVSALKKAMRYLVYSLLFVFLFSSCTKENDSKIEIYLLKSFSISTNQATAPHTLVISNPVLSETPFVEDGYIRSYSTSDRTFQLTTNIGDAIKDYGADKAFAVTVNRQPVYYGLFHPGYLSSLPFGVAMIDPILSFNNQIRVDYVLINGMPDLVALDKRNDSLLINSLRSSGRLR
jgi:hypothetical protein